MPAGPEGNGMVGAQSIPVGFPAGENETDRPDQLTVARRADAANTTTADNALVVPRKALRASHYSEPPALVTRRPSIAVREPQVAEPNTGTDAANNNIITDVEKNVAEVRTRLEKEKPGSIQEYFEQMDESVKAHSQGVASLAKEAASLLGWSPEAVDATEIAGLYHDVGKREKDLLPKYDSDIIFTDEVRKMMSLAHSLYGEEILDYFQGQENENPQDFDIAKKGARFHHDIKSKEFRDELTQQEQSIIVLVAMADQLHAMKLDRSRGYIAKRAEKGAFSMEDVQNEWTKKIGDYLTPEYVDVFNKIALSYELKDALALVDDETKDNPYLADAVGFATELVEQTDHTESLPAYRARVDTAARTIGEYAVSTGKGELSDRIFDLLSPAQQWLLIGTAYDADRLDREQLDTWHRELVSRDETDPLALAASFLALTEIELHNYRTSHEPDVRQKSLEGASAYKDAFTNSINEIYTNGGLTDMYSSLQLYLYQNRMMMSLAKADLWMLIDDIPTMDNENLECTLVSKALAGKFENTDERFCRQFRIAERPVLRWISDKKNNVPSEKPERIGTKLPKTSRRILESLAPELIGQVEGWKPSSYMSGLRLALATENAHAALTTYSILKNSGLGDEALEASLVMAQHLEKKQAEEKAKAGIESEHIYKAVELLQVGDTDNTYLADTAGFTKQLVIKADLLDNPTIRAQEIRKIALELGEHAVTTGNSQLADHIFTQLSPADKWLLYATARNYMLDPEQLSQWQHELDTKRDTAGSRNPTVTAARLLAQSEIALHNSSFQEAITHKNAFLKVLNAYNVNSIAPGTEREYTDRLRTAFASGGLWEQVGEIVPHFEEKTSQLQLASRALAGQLGTKDQGRLLVNGQKGDLLLWIDTRQKDATVDPPKIQDIVISNETQEFLERVAPKLMAELGLQPTSDINKLRMQLADADFEMTKITYNDIVSNTTAGVDVLRASLLLSQHEGDLETSSPVHEMYNKEFTKEFKTLAAYVSECLEKGDEPDQNKLDSELFELYQMAIDKRQDPQQAMLEQAWLAHLYRLAKPNAHFESHLNESVREQWTVFERREGMAEQLPGLSAELRKFGYTIIRRWKPEGYVGYEPVVLKDPSYLNKTHRGQELDKEIALWQQAAEKLNKLLKEQRYEVKPEDVVYTSIEAHFQDYTLSGSWPRYGDEMELMKAAELLAIGRELNTMPELTERLEAVMSEHNVQTEDIAQLQLVERSAFSDITDSVSIDGQEFSYETLIAKSPSIGPRVFFQGTFGAHSNYLGVAVSNNDLFVRDEHGIKVGFRPTAEMLKELAPEQLSEFGLALKEIIKGRIVIDIGYGLPDQSQIPILISQAFGAREYHGVDISLEDLQQTVKDLAVSDLHFNYHGDDALHFLSQLPDGQGFVFHLAGLDSTIQNDMINRAYITALLTEMQRVTKPGDAIIIGQSTYGFRPEDYGFVLKHTVTNVESKQQVYVREADNPGN